MDLGLFLRRTGRTCSSDPPRADQKRLPPTFWTLPMLHYLLRSRRCLHFQRHSAGLHWIQRQGATAPAPPGCELRFHGVVSGQAAAVAALPGTAAAGNRNEAACWGGARGLPGPGAAGDRDRPVGLSAVPGRDHADSGTASGTIGTSGNAGRRLRVDQFVLRASGELRLAPASPLESHSRREMPQPVRARSAACRTRSPPLWTGAHLSGVNAARKGLRCKPADRWCRPPSAHRGCARGGPSGCSRCSACSLP